MQHTREFAEHRRTALLSAVVSEILLRNV